MTGKALVLKHIWVGTMQRVEKEFSYSGDLVRVDVVAGQVHRHRSAEEYTWSDQDPTGKGRESSDRIDRGDHYREESPAKQLISRRSIRRRY
jgi:hypothetical protein